MMNKKKRKIYLLELLDELNGETKYEFRRWLFFTLFITLLPFIIRLIFIVCTFNFSKFQEVITSGEFFIYSVSLLAPTLYLINSYLDMDLMRSKKFPYLTAFFLTIIGIIIFTLITASIPLKPIIIMPTSLILFLLSIYVAMKSKLVEIYFLNAHNLKETESSNIKNLSSELDNLNLGMNNE